MLANINDVYLFFNAILNKNQSGAISPDDFNRFINVGQQQYFRKMLGLPELYTVEKREAPIEVQTTQVISDSMRYFIKSVPLQKSGTGFNWPTDLAALLPNNFLFTYQNPDGTTGATIQPIDFVSIGELGYRQNNYVTMPANEYPSATYLNGQIVVYPDTINTMYGVYYRYPVTPVFAYTINANDQVVYNALTSVDLEFPNLDWENITHVAIKYAGQFLREEFILQTEQARIVQGQ